MARHNLGTVVAFEVTRTLKKKQFWLSTLLVPVVLGIVIVLVVIANTTTASKMDAQKDATIAFTYSDASGYIDPAIAAGLGGTVAPDEAQAIADVKAGKSKAYFAYPAKPTTQATTVYGADLGIFDNGQYSSAATQVLVASARTSGASVFAYHVHDPERYGVVAFDAQRRAISIEEKPKLPKSNYAVTGLYFYDNQVCDIAAQIPPSTRGELEITDVNRVYLEQNQLNVEIMGRGYAWLDTGTHDSLLEAASFIATLQKRQGLQVSCPEEIAFGQKWIDADQIQKLAAPLAKNGYGQYLLNLIKQA